jgi:type IV fimbrial biogenesis protein FimT
MDGSNRKYAGFTLLELLITLILVSILVFLSTPSFSDLIHQNGIDSAKQELKKAIHLARTEAVMRGRTVYLCLTKDHINCTEDLGSLLMVFTDSNYQGGRSIDSRTLMIYRWPTKIIKVSYNRPLLKFSPRGDAIGTNGTFTICHRRVPKKDGLIISSLGRVREARDYNNDGVKESSPTSPLVCS